MLALEYQKYETQIVDNLIKEGLVDNTALEQIKEKNSRNIENEKNTFFEKIYALNHFDNKINVLNSKGEKLKTITIPIDKTIPFKEDEWSLYGNKIIALDNEHNRKKNQNGFKNNEIKLGIKDNCGYLVNNDFESEEKIIFTENIISEYTSKAKAESLPLDFFFSNDFSLLCVSNRGEGTIHLINLKTDELLKSIDIRAKGGSKNINVTIATQKSLVFITDNQSPNLTIINIFNFSVETKNLGQGILGNILLTPDENTLYLITTKPKQGLKIINVKDFTIKKEFPLKGELFSLAEASYDILSINKNKSFIYFVTHISDPEPFTPVITVFDLKEEKAIKRFSIKDSTKLISIGSVQENPVFSHKKELLELLIDNGILDKNKLEELKNKIEEETNLKEIQMNFNVTVNPNNNLLNTPQKSVTKEVDIDSFTKPKEKKSEDDIEWKINLKAKKIEGANITPGLDEILLKKCLEKIWQEYEAILKYQSEAERWENPEAERELRFLKVRSELEKVDSFPAGRLNDAITKSRTELEWYDLTIIRLRDLLTNYHFEIAFHREECIEWIREKERDSLIETGLKTIATNCPNCDAQLLGSYTCRQCGFELEKPEDALRRRLLQIASFDPFENLKKGNMMVIDVINHKIMEVDSGKNIVWEVKKDALHSIEVDLERPRDAIRLKNNLTLVVDYAKSRVFKLTPKGRIFWEVDYRMSPQHELKNPVSAACMESKNTIIVDYGNHRVLEIDEYQEIVWQYGQKGVHGIGENMLNFPTYIQRTDGNTNIITDAMNHRVIELQDDKIIWQYGNETNLEGNKGKGVLNAPLNAIRSKDGATLILDSGNKRVVEVSPEKEILWEYKTDSDAGHVENPIRVYRLRNGNIFLVGDKKVAEIDYRKKEPAWIYSMEEFMSHAEKEVRVVDENVKKIKVRHGVSNPYLQRRLDTATLKNAEDNMNSLLTKEAAAQARTSRSHVLLTLNAKVLPLNLPLIDKSKGEIYLIDRKGNHVWSCGSELGLVKPNSVVFTPTGSIFIADTENSRIIEIDYQTKNILWTLDSSKIKLKSPKGLSMTKNNTLLISDSLLSKVIEVNKENNEIVWFFENTNVLKAPFHAKRLTNGNTLIVDWMNHIILEVNENKDIVWSYGVTKVSGKDDGKLNYPEYAKRLTNGNTLIADTKNARVIEVSPEKEIVWSFEVQGTTKLMSPYYVKRLNDGNTIITHNNKQIIEVDSSGKVLWKYMH